MKSNKKLTLPWADKFRELTKDVLMWDYLRIGRAMELFKDYCEEQEKLVQKRFRSKK